MEALVSKATMILSLQRSPASEISAFKRMRALSSRRAGPFPLRISVSSCSRSSTLNRTTYFFTEISFPAMIAPTARIMAQANHPILSNSLKRATSANVTGFANLEATLGGKWLELLSEIAPGLKRAAIMFNPDRAEGSAYMPSFEAAARSLKVVPIIAPVHSDVEIETAIVALGRGPAGGLV